MNLTRRDILKLFSAASLSAIAPLDALARVNGQEFSSECFGISLSFPADWHEVLLSDYVYIMKRDYGRIVDSVVPLFMCARFKEPNEIANDSFRVFADRVSTENSHHPVELHEIISVTSDDCDNFKLYSKPHSIEFAGKSASKCAYSYTEHASTGHVYNFYEEQILVCHEDLVVLISFEIDATNSERSQIELGDIMSSIKIN